ncbi:MAG: hypothetical protein EOP53_20540 [Sphingobacteriales bacterium]|nr:MAG: hypothetical protein EOP53_20540 [Sphingobacteriales bacterium]
MSEKATIGDRVSWLLGHANVEGQIIDIYKKEASEAEKKSVFLEAAYYNVLLIQLNNGRKVLKREADVSIEKS